MVASLTVEVESEDTPYAAIAASHYKGPCYEEEGITLHSSCSHHTNCWPGCQFTPARRIKYFKAYCCAGACALNQCMRCRTAQARMLASMCRMLKPCMARKTLNMQYSGHPSMGGPSIQICFHKKTSALLQACVCHSLHTAKAQSPLSATCRLLKTVPVPFRRAFFPQLARPRCIYRSTQHSVGQAEHASA